MIDIISKEENSEFLEKLLSRSQLDFEDINIQVK